MQIDQVLNLTTYNLHSTSRLAARDDAAARLWLDGADPLYRLYLRLRNRRILSRKEFYETAFVLDRLLPELARVPYVMEMAGGHGLVGMSALLHCPGLLRVTTLDKRQPEAYARLREALAVDFPFIKVRTRYLEMPIERSPTPAHNTMVVGIHCCGSLTDDVAALARSAGAPFAVMPCCERKELLPKDIDPLSAKGEQLQRVVGDLRRARWEGWGYRVEEKWIPARVSKRGRIFICWPGGQ